MNTVPSNIIEYLQAGKTMVCEMDVNPFCCEFWSAEELEQFNCEYQVPEYAPGYFGFATSGGGELFAISPTGSVVCLPFIGMEPKAATEVASSWQEFEVLLKNAL